MKAVFGEEKSHYPFEIGSFFGVVRLSDSKEIYYLQWYRLTDLLNATDKIGISFKRKISSCDRPKEIANSHFFYPILNNEGLTDDDTLCID